MNKLKIILIFSFVSLALISFGFVSPLLAGKPQDVRDAAILWNQGVVTEYGSRIFPGWDGNVINHDEPSFIFLAWIYVDDGTTNEWKKFPQPLKYELFIGGQEIHLLTFARGRGDFKNGELGLPWDQTYGPVYYFYQTFDAYTFEQGFNGIEWTVSTRDPNSSRKRII